MFLNNKVSEDKVAIFMKRSFTNTLQPLLGQSRQHDATIPPGLVFSNLKKKKEYLILCLQENIAQNIQISLAPL